MKRVRTSLVAVLVVCCLITATAFAAVSLGLDQKFLGFLNPSSSVQAEYLASGAFAVGAQAVNQNGTLTIKQVIGDGNLTYILMDFTAPDGTVLDKADYQFETADLNNADQGFFSTDLIFLQDEVDSDHKISMVMSIMTKKSMAGQRVTLKLTNLQGADSPAGAFSTVLSGDWEASFPLNFKEYSAAYPVDKAITMFGYTATIQTISVSPISVAVKLESPFVKEISQAAGGGATPNPAGYIDNFPITIHYEDGTSETTTVFHGLYHADCLLGELLTIKTFETVINDKAIESVTFFGTEIPIAHS